MATTTRTARATTPTPFAPLAGAGDCKRQRHVLPGVGQNLQDHVTTVLIYRTRHQQETLGFSLKGALNMVKSVFEWRSKRSGWLTTNVAESQAFMKTRPDVEAPDIQLAFCTGIVDDHTRKAHLGHGYTLHVTLMRPKSRGSVTLLSAKPTDAPRIDPAYLQDPEDPTAARCSTPLTVTTGRRSSNSCATTPTPNTTP